MKRILPHLCLVMSVCMAVIVYIDDRNPMMGFLKSGIGRIYSLAFCVLVLITSIVFIVERRRKDRQIYRNELRQQKLQEAAHRIEDH